MFHLKHQINIELLYKQKWKNMKKFEWSGEELTGKTQHHLCFCERLIFYALIMPMYHLKYEKTLPE